MVVNTADELEKVGPDTDTTPVAAKLDGLIASVQQLAVTDTTKPLRDAAAAALTELQTSITDPTKKQEASKKGADALRAFETSLCS